MKNIKRPVFALCPLFPPDLTGRRDTPDLQPDNSERDTHITATMEQPAQVMEKINAASTEQAQGSGMRLSRGHTPARHQRRQNTPPTRPAEARLNAIHSNITP